MDLGCVDALAVDWGDVPTWATAVAATLALIFAGLAAKASRGMLAVENERDEKATEQQRERALREERAEQADLVAAWPRKNDRRGVVLRNGSSLPIYNVTVAYLKEELRRDLHFDTVAPGDLDLVAPEGSAGTDAHGYDIPEYDLSDARHEVTFTDTAGRTWKRDVRGQLRLIRREAFGELSGVVPGVQGNFEVRNDG